MKPFSFRFIMCALCATAALMFASQTGFAAEAGTEDFLPFGDSVSQRTVQNTRNFSYRYNDELIHGLEAYKNKDWANALFFLRKAAGDPQTASEEVWYLAIGAQMNLHEYAAVLRDSEIFISHFASSPYRSYVEYQAQLARFGLKLYAEAAEGFSAFCARYSDHPLFSSALFWTAESLYRCYEFARALPLYRRVVQEFPESSKYGESLYRIEILKQREREEKLLYLLRLTGEEAAAAKEDYERRIKQMQSDEAFALKRKVQDLETQAAVLQSDLDEARRRNAELDGKVDDLLSLNEQLRSEADIENAAAAQTGQEPFTSDDADSSLANGENTNADQRGALPDGSEDWMRLLREKAGRLQRVLDERSVRGGT
ncbi:MAG: hypothetical protein ACFNKF_01935 [Treponema lecithinolyticum]|uniref:hypothetical protein n=1 Tax=Treponema lecithinolyticum TaxID=53418 RepID=UPI00361C47E1